MSEPDASASGGRAAMSPGRAFAWYSLLRLGLFAASYLVLLAIGLRELLALGLAVLMSALLSVVLLRRQREAFTSASMAKAQERREAREARSRRLSEDPDGSSTT